MNPDKRFKLTRLKVLERARLRDFLFPPPTFRPPNRKVERRKRTHKQSTQRYKLRNNIG